MPWLFQILFLIRSFFFAVAGSELRKVSKLFIEMHIEEFLARLVKSRAHGVFVVVGDAVEKGPEAASKSTFRVSEIARIGKSESNIALMKDTNKKRHRDGTSSCSHHTKKFKEPMMCPSSDGVAFFKGWCQVLCSNCC